MSYLVLARKWRPQRFADVVGQKHVSRTLSNAILTGRLSHAYLFAGPRGVGKTSMARILAKALNCEQGPTAEPCDECAACRTIIAGHCLDVIEIDGASNRGIDDVRQLRESVKYAPASVRSKVYIIDEVHMLTTDAFNALLKTLEEPPRHVSFVLATTEPLKVPATILSRCQRFDFGRLTVDELAAHLQRIILAEGIVIDEEALRLLARKAEGSVRDALTLLDQVAATGAGPFDAAAIQALLGLSGTALYFEISGAVIGGDAAQVLRVLRRAYQEGLNLQEVAEELVQHFRNLLLLSLGEGLEEILDATAEERSQLLAQARGVRPADALRWLRILLDVAARMRRSAHGQVHLEVALLEMTALPRAIDLQRVLAWLREGAVGDARAGTGDPGPAAAGADRGAAVAPAAERPAPRAGGGGAGEAADANLAGVWEQVCARVQRERAFLGSCLHGSRVAGVEQGRLHVVLDDINGFKRDQVIKPVSQRFILQALEEILGRPLGLRFSGEAGTAGAADAIAPASGAAGGAQAAREAPGAAPAGGAGAARVRKIAEMMDGDIIGPSR